MAYNTNPTHTSYAGARAIDPGLQSYMQSVYRTMSWGLCVTGLTAFVASSIPFFMKPGVNLIVMIASLFIVFAGFRPARVQRLPASSLKATFTGFAVVMGLMLSVLFHIYTGGSLARVFFVTAAAFAGTSLYGYTTHRDLAGVGSFMFMGLFGIVIASVVNLFMHSPMVYFVTSALSVIIFTGLTAWETQRLKSVYAANGGEANDKMAVLGALNLYMNFINLFQALLSFMGDRR